MRFLLAVALVACSSSSPQVKPAPSPPDDQGSALVAPPVPDVLDAGAAPEPQTPPPPVAPPLAADGASCLKDNECSSGVCEGLGCSDDLPGACAPAQRGCTRDLRSYCGCDGKTFKASGSCPGRRYEAKGACPTGNARAAGAFCLKASECASKICDGIGCADDTPGRCADKRRACTADVVQFCTCDGKTVTGSSSCPGVRVAKRGTCDEDDED